MSEQIWAIPSFLVCVKNNLKKIMDHRVLHVVLKSNANRVELIIYMASHYSKTSNREVLMSLTRGTLKVFFFFFISARQEPHGE